MITKPDRDNVDKLILDAMKSSGFWKDDCQVCDGPVKKLYVGRGNYRGPGREPGAMITIEFNRSWPYKKPLIRQSKRKVKTAVKS